MIGTMNKRSPLMKTIGIFLAVCFMCYNVSFAAPLDAAAAPAKDAAKAAITADDVGIAIDAGTIKARHNGQSGKIVVHIQDAHCNYEAQNNINKILDQLSKECGMDIISVEGAEGIVDTTWFKAFPDSEIRKEVATYFMKKGEITGAEFFSITSDFSGTIFGAETRDYYIKNLKSFTAVYPYKEAIEKYFTDTRSVVSKLKGVIYSPELRELDSKITAFDAKEIELSAFAEYLYKEISKHKIKLADYPNFKKLVETLEYEKKINFDIVDQERSAYIDFLSKKLTKEQMTNLVTESINFKKGHIKAADFYSFLRDLAKEHNIPIVQDYPNLFYYYIYTKLYDGIDNESLFKELDRIEMALKKALFKDPGQEELDRVSTLVEMYGNLVNIELTNEDYDLFREYSAKTPLEDVMSFIDKQCRKYNLNCEVGQVPAQIRDNMPKMIDFYEIAIKRDNALIDNTLAQMEKEGKDRSVLIAGGFHTRGIKDLLAKQGISYVVVTPKITKDVETPYIKVLTNQRTSLEDIITENASMPGMGITASREEIVRAKGSMLAPLARLGFTIPLYLENPADPTELKALSAAIGAVEGGRDTLATAKDTYREMVSALVRGWLMKVKNNPATKPEVWAHAVENPQELMGAYLYQYQKEVSRLVQELKPEARAVAEETAMNAVTINVSDEFRKIFQDAVREAQLGTPGQNAVNAEGIKKEDDEFGKALTKAQHDALNVILKKLIDSGKFSVEKISGVNVYWLSGLEEAIIENNLAGGVQLPVNIVHPGRGKDHNLKNAYLSAKLKADGPNKLTQDELQGLVAHEKAHIADPSKSEGQIIANLRQAAIIDSIRTKMLNIAKAVSAELGPVPAVEGTLLKDATYGDAAAKHIQAARTKIADLKKSGDAEGAARLEAELRNWMKTVQARRGNIDRMQSVLTGKTYNGYDVIIVSSSTPDEVKYQQEVLEALFAGRTTANGALGKKVCILSVLDESEGGQIIGQGVTWLEAVKKYAEWAQKNGVEVTNLDDLFAQDKVKIAIYHNGGKGERASPATQSLGNSRGAQKIVGNVTTATGEKVGIELIPAVILSTADAAITNDASRVDTYWANQVSFGTIDLSSIRRSNSHFDKLVVKLPAAPKKKDLFDYGTAVIDAAGRIVKFLANKVLTAKNPATGQYENNPKFTAELKELESSPNGAFDFGSFSMSRDMHYALLSYWKDRMGIFEKIAQDPNKRSPISRDIDPAFVQIIVPMMSGLIGKDLPADFPTALDLTAAGEADREAVLTIAYNKIIGVIPVDQAGALDKIYNAKKKDKDGKEVLDIEKRRSVLESIEFFILNPQLFADRSRVVGSIDLGADSHWFAYKRMLDLSNEKFLMLSDIIGKNVELDTDGSIIETPLDGANLDAVRAEDARRVRGITKDAVATFVVNGELVTLTLDQVKAGWRDEKNGIEVKGSIIHGNTVLMPGSRVINSVVNDSQGKIVVTNSYVETSTATRITAINSIIYKATDPSELMTKKEIVAYAYRAPKADGTVQIADSRFQTLGYDLENIAMGFPSTVFVLTANGPTAGEFNFGNTGDVKMELTQQPSQPSAGRPGKIDILVTVKPSDGMTSGWEGLIIVFSSPELGMFFSSPMNDKGQAWVRGIPVSRTDSWRSAGPKRSLVRVGTTSKEALLFLSPGQTRMRAPIGYDPKGATENDETPFGDNEFTFKQIRDMECNRAANDAIENANKNAVRISAGMILPGMAAGLSFEEAYSFVVKEAAERAARIKAMDAAYKPLKNGTSGMRGMVSQAEAEDALITPEMTAKQIADTRGRITRAILAEGFMSDMECYINVRGFIRFLYAANDIKPGATVAFGGDLRPTTPRVALAIYQAIKDEGCVPYYAGPVSSPALAYYARVNGIPSVMITGSHIPADRNGMKFTKVAGEVLKTDETKIGEGIRKARDEVYGMKPEMRPFDELGMFKPEKTPQAPTYEKDAVMELYVQRYLQALPADYLKGAKIVLYQHSAVGRDALEKIFKGLGAEVITIERSERFIPVDTEKISERTKQVLWKAAVQYKPFVIVSADGDTDRPLLADENGNFLTGDRLGGLVSIMLGPKAVAVPDTTNDGIVTLLRGVLNVKVEETQVGSPYIVAEIEAGADTGWEANGGYLLGKDWQLPGWKKPLTSLPTRDAALPLIMATRLALERTLTMSTLIATLPPRFNIGVAVTNEDQGCETYNVAMGQEIMGKLKPSDPNVIQADFLADGTVRVTYRDKSTKIASPETAKEFIAKRDMWAGKYLTPERGFTQPVTQLRFVDGVKVTFLNPAAPEKPGTVAHIRASGNAPDFRLIVTEDTQEKSTQLSNMWKVIGPEVIRDFGMTPGVNAIRTMPEANTSIDRVVKAILEGKPFVVKPYLEPKVWGEQGIGEAWFGAELGAKSSTVVLGNDEVPLAEVIKYVPEEFLGLGAVKNFGDTMPLVKILTPTARLSVQFHDTKNELWVVMATNVQNPSIILGFSERAVKEYGDKVAEKYGEALTNYGVALNKLIDVLEKNGFLHALEKTKNVEIAAAGANYPAAVRDALDLYNAAKAPLTEQKEGSNVIPFYNFRPVKTGDVIPLSAGTLHALGEGVTVYEPQIAGPTQSLEDGATYPVRYYFPGFRRPGAQKQLDIARVGEIKTGVAVEQKPLVVRRDAGMVVERLPGSFEDKGLEVHRITIKAGAEMDVPAVSTFHNLVALEGRAKVIVDGEEYDVPRASARGEMLIIPATVKGYRLIAESDAKILDTFTPVPETTEIPINLGTMVPGTNSPSTEERLVFADFPGITSTFDQLYLIDKMAVPEIVKNRKHELLVREGTVRIEKVDGTLVKELTPGQKLVIDANFGEYVLAKTGDRNAVVKVDYEKTDAEKAVYATFDAVRKHMGEIKAGQIDLILPAEMFVPGGRETPGSAMWEQEQLRKYVSEKITIRVYSANVGLKELEDKTVDKGTIAILAATERSLRETGQESQKVKDFLTSKRGKVRVMAIPNIDKEQALEGRGWFFNREVEGTGLLLAAVTPETIRVEGEGNAADDLQKLMGQLTGKTVPRDYLYYMLSHDEMGDALKNLPLEFQKDPLGWLKFIVQNLLLKMPMKPFDATEQLEQRRKVMWSV